MQNLVIKQITFDELYNDPAFASLMVEYEEESAIDGLPSIKVKIELYRNYEQNGAFYVVASYHEDKLIGFATVLSPIMPHFSALISVCESLFVAKEFRKTGAGLKLIKDCENHATKLGSPGLLMSAPMGGSLAEILPKVGYKETNRVFFRKF